MNGAGDSDGYLVVTLTSAGRCIDDHGGGHDRRGRRGEVETTRAAVPCQSGGFDWRDESVALPRHRFDESWSFGIVIQRLAQLADAVVEPAVEVDVDLVAPDGRVKFRSRHQRAGSDHEPDQRPRRLALKRDRRAIAAELSSIEVDLVGSKLAPAVSSHEELDENATGWLHGAMARPERWTSARRTAGVAKAGAALMRGALVAREHGDRAVGESRPGKADEHASGLLARVADFGEDGKRPAQPIPDRREALLVPARAEKLTEVASDGSAP